MDYEGPRYPYGVEDYDGGTTGKRRLYVILAIVWFLAGLVFLGFAGYRVLHQTPQDVSWVIAKPVADSPVAVAAAEGKPAPPLGDQPFHLVIDKIGVNAPVDSYGLASDGSPEVPYRSDLVAWYTFSSPPDVGENAVMAGHYTWNGDAVFRHLGDLAVGDRIAIVGDQSGQTLVYRVSLVTLVDPKDIKAAQEWMGPTGANDLTLITCGGEHFTTDDPILGGDYTQRQIIRAEFVAIT
jgi:LPXTG-site transpeptidase (sortase) family protein